MAYKWDEMTHREKAEVVCEKVFGYAKDLHGEEFTWVKRDDNNEVVEYQPCWFSPSNDIRDAWEVIEKMSEDFAVNVWNSTIIDEGWVCMFGIHLDSAPTAPEAICKAALKAVGVEIE